MSNPTIAQIERSLGRPLPAAYRVFLESHASRALDPNWLVRTADPIPGGGPEEYLRSLATIRKPTPKRCPLPTRVLISLLVGSRRITFRRSTNFWPRRRAFYERVASWPSWITLCRKVRRAST